MTDQPTPPAAAGEPPANLMAELTADPVVLASGVFVALGLLLLIVGVAGSWHWKAAVLGAAVCSVAAFALVGYAATQRRDEFPDADAAWLADLADPEETSHPIPDRPPGTPRTRGGLRRPPRDTNEADPDVPDAAAPRKSRPAPADDALTVKSSDEAEPSPRPRFAGFGKPKPDVAPPEVKPPPPQPTNVQVMHVQGSNVRVAPVPAPMPISQPQRPVAKPPSTPPATPPTIQVGVPREPGFPTYQPVDPDAPVIQVRNRYHRPDCRYVAVAAAQDAINTTVGAARATNAMPCGVCRP